MKTQTFHTFTLLYSAPLLYLRHWFWITQPKLRREEAGSISKSESQKLQRLYRQGGAAYGSVRNLVKASNLPVSKVRQLLHSKLYFIKVTLATRKFKRMNASARIRKELCYLDLAYVDKLGKDINGVKYHPVHQELFDRTADAKRIKPKNSKETFRAILTEITMKNRRRNIWIHTGTKFDRELKLQ